MNELPKDFDWKYYLEYYEDLVKDGIFTEKGAKNHYLIHGKYENRIYCEQDNYFKYFVFSSGKTGSKTLEKSIKNVGRVLHVHSGGHFKEGRKSKQTLKEVIINSSKKFEKIYVIDSYREPFERGISSFFQNIDKHCPEWGKMSTDELISFFNEKKLYLLDLYHSYYESWGYFDISTNVEFDFEKGYITRQFENIIFIKTRLKESYRWSEIFSELLEESLTFNHENDSSEKKYNKQYIDFKKQYKLPESIKKQFLDTINSESGNFEEPFYVTWLEMKKFMTENEINEYLKKWIFI